MSDDGEEDRYEPPKPKAREKARADRVANAWRQTLASPQGRIVLYELLLGMGWARTPFVAGSPDLSSHAAGAHAQAVALWNRLCDISFEEALMMLRENRDA